MSEVLHETLDLKGAWRIAWFGRLLDNPQSITSDLRIRAYLGRLVDQELHGTSNKGKMEATQREMLLPIGDLPRLHLNAVLTDGWHDPNERTEFTFERQAEMVIDCSRSNITVIDRNARDASGQLIIPDHSRRAELSNSARDGYFVCFGANGNPYAIIIPSVEIFRFFYATSSVLTKALLSDKFQDPHKELWNIDKSSIDEQTKLAVLWLRKKMLDADALFLARFAFDEYALKQAQEIYLFAAKREEKDGVIKALPPFQGNVKMAYLYTTLNNSRVESRYVTQLLQCNWKPPFSSLRWDRDNDGRPAEVEKEKKPPRTKPGLIINTESDDPKKPKLGGTPATSNTTTTHLKEQEIIDRFPELQKTPAIKLPHTHYKTRRTKKCRQLFIEAYGYSTINPTASKEIIGKAVIEGGIEKDPNPDSSSDIDPTIGQKNYLDVLHYLKKIQSEKLAFVNFITVLETQSVVEEVEFNVSPTHIHEKRRSWLYADYEKTKRRLILLAEITFENKTRYIIELQERLDKVNSTLIFWEEFSNAKILRDSLHKILMCCIEAGGTSLKSDSRTTIQWGRRSHTIKYPDNNGFDQIKASRHFLEKIFSSTSVKQPEK